METATLPLKPLEFALNRALAMDPDVRRRLQPLVGRCLAIELSGLAAPLALHFEQDSVRLDTHAEGADAHLRASPAALLGFVLRRGEGGAQVDFRGDVAVVQAVKHLFMELDIDLEEQVSRFTGDVVAHQIGSLARGGLDWLARTRNSFERNLGEYLTEEADQLATRAEIESFLSDVDRLRQAADRFEARLRTLERS